MPTPRDGPVHPSQPQPLPSLEDLGWGGRWAALLAAAGVPAAQPARVVRVERGAVLLATGSAWRSVPVAPTSEPLVVGDWVAVVDGRSVAVLARSGLLQRLGADGHRQPIAANVDVVVVVCGSDRPRPPGRVHRAATQAWDAGALPLVVLTKVDLLDDPPNVVAAAARAELPGVDVVATSAVTGLGLDVLSGRLAGRTSVLIGESGAGKSRLLGALTGADVVIGEVRPGDAKGRHTTTRRELYLLPGGGVVIDTPGIRSLGLWADEASVTAAFPDVEELAAGCRFRDCRHGAEPGCAVLGAVEAGVLGASRLEQHRALRKEARALARRRDPHEERRAGRQSSKVAREAQRRKGRRR